MHENVYLIRSADPESALADATRIARSNEDLNNRGQSTFWVFSFVLCVATSRASIDAAEDDWSAGVARRRDPMEQRLGPLVRATKRTWRTPSTKAKPPSRWLFA